MTPAEAIRLDEGRQTQVPLLQTRGLTKRFTATVALDHVDLELRSGEVHALLGQNGAGKSTLIKILAGIFPADAGEILVNGIPIQPTRNRLPISFIHQDLGLVESMTVAENIALVAGYPKTGPFIAWRRVREQARVALTNIGSDVSPDVNVSTLPAAERSMVAISRALAVRGAVLVLDEPTSTLPHSDVGRLFTVLRRLRQTGVGILYVTHRLDEVFQVADRVTVLRDGRRISTRPIGAVSAEQMVSDIVGGKLSAAVLMPAKPRNEVALKLVDVRVGSVGPASLRVARGEIVGLVGLVGAGHHVIGRAVAADLRITGGEIWVGTNQLNARGPRQALGAGIGFLSSKRAEESLVTTLTVLENLYPNPTLAGETLLVPMRHRKELSRALKVMRQFSVRPPDVSRPITMLSGGNQQKVVLARVMQMGRQVLVLEEPTFGVDVGAKADIYELMRRVAEQGKAILLISSDFEEVAAICHRALVFNRGRITSEIGRDQLTVERLIAAASGVG